MTVGPGMAAGSSRRPGRAGRWRIVLPAAAVGLAVGGLLGWVLGGSGTTRVWSGRLQNGVVPVGWAHSQDGAVAAATNYIVAASSELLFDAAKRPLVVDAIAAPEARARLRHQLDATAKTAAAALTGGLRVGNGNAALDPAKVIFQIIPVRYQVELYDGAHARIAIWQTGIAGYEDSSLPVQQAWGVTTVELQWIDDDWKEVGATVQDGPVPVADDSPSTPAPVLVGVAQHYKEYQPYLPGPQR